MYFSTVCRTDTNKDIGHSDRVRLARGRLEGSRLL